MFYYAVAKGRKPGIYSTWDECSAQVNKFPGSVYKKFTTKSEAQNFIEERACLSTDKNFIKKKTAKYSVSEALSKQFFPLGNKGNINTPTNSLPSSLLLKRKLSTVNNNDNKSIAQPNKKRKIASDKADIKFNLSKQDCAQNSQVDLIADKDGYMNVFTDGACSSNGYKGAKAGIGVWFCNNHPLNVSQPVKGRPTNNVAEIQAVTVAAKQAKKAGIKKLRINTDSKFLISCITEWMPKWKKRDWVTINNKPVINKIELLEMEKELKSLTIMWNHVNGHVGIYGNEMADKLAKEGCLQYKNQDG